jgi:eukaryotic-like serine/threonine-protein kinase
MSQRSDRVKSLSSKSRFRVGNALVQPDRLVVSLDSREHSVEPRVMEVLVVLAENSGKTVSKEQLLIDVWRGTFYGDNPVEKTISQLRREVFGDDARAPRYIETVPKRGYRLIASVSFPDDYRRSLSQSDAWPSRSPYVGLSAFDSAHAGVFFGRSRMTAELLGVMRRQIDNQRRFVLICGASGCGKSSLLQAGAIPLLRQKGGFDGLYALSVAACDLAAAQGGEVLMHLTSALATWSLGERPVFPPQPVAALAQTLVQHPDTIAAVIEEAIRRHGDRQTAEHPHSHLLLTIDHAEALVSSGYVSHQERSDVSLVLQALCDCPHTLVVMIVRGDFYPKLIDAMPDLIERKAGDGHIDVLMPTPGEIAQIIRGPAMLAGLNFEEDKQTLSRLDDVLRDAAIEQPDALPLLQHTLQSLYERRGEAGELSFEAYRRIGGLEGALTYRAEEVFCAQPVPAQERLDRVLSQLIVVQSDSDSVSARRAPWSALADEHARTFVESFIRARLFVGELENGHPSFGVAHEALLRQWPRAREWAQENRRLLQARARLQRAAVRWVEEGRRSDHLLNPGQPMIEAQEAARELPGRLSPDEHALLAASERQHRRSRRRRRSAVSGLIALAVVSSVLAVLAVREQREAERRREQALQVTDFMLLDLADKLRPLGRLQLLDDISGQVLGLLDEQPAARLRAEDLVNRSRALRTLGEVLMAQARFNEADTAFRGADHAARLAIERAPTSTAAISESGVAAYWLGYTHFRRAEYDKASVQWNVYLQRSTQLMRQEPGETRWIIEKSYALNNLGTLARERGRIDDALAYFQRSADLKKRALQFRADDSALQYELIDTLSWISSGEESRGNLAEAAAGYKEQIAMLRTLIAKDPQAMAWQRRLATSLLRSATLAVDQNRMADASTLIAESIHRLDTLTALEPDNRVWARDLAHALLQGSEIARLLGDAGESQRRLIRARAVSSTLRGHGEGKGEGRHQERGEALPEWRRMDALIQLQLAEGGPPDGFSAAIAQLRELTRGAAQDSTNAIALADALIARGIAYAHRGRTDQARADWGEALGWLQAQHSEQRAPKIVFLRVRAHLLLGDEGKTADDIAWLQRIGHRLPPEATPPVPATAASGQ